jgi:hypothetical protein
MLVIAAIVEVFVGALLALGAYFSYADAEASCQRTVAHSEKVRQPWRSILYPRWFYSSGRCVRHTRIASLGGMLMGALLCLIAAITLFSSH